MMQRMPDFKFTGLLVKPVFILALFIYCISFSVFAQEIKVLVVASDTTDIYSQVYQSIKNAITSDCAQHAPLLCSQQSSFDFVNENNIEKHLWKKDYNLIVTLGRSAADKVIAVNTKIPVIFSLIPKSAFNELSDIGKHEHSTASFIDQPPSRIVALTQIILGNDSNIGLLLGPNTESYLDDYKSVFNKKQLHFSSLLVNDEKEIGPALKSILSSSDVLLAIPDPLLYNRKTIFNILLSTYNKHIPVIGFSAAYVKAGALAAVYSSPADIGRSTANIILKFYTSGRLPKPGYSSQFSVSVNNTVANSLNITIPNNTQLKTRLLESEK